MELSYSQYYEFSQGCKEAVKQVVEKLGIEPESKQFGYKYRVTTAYICENDPDKFVYVLYENGCDDSYDRDVHYYIKAVDNGILVVDWELYSYNPYFGCEIAELKWVDDKVVVKYEEKHNIYNVELTPVSKEEGKNIFTDFKKYPTTSDFENTMKQINGYLGSKSTDEKSDGSDEESTGSEAESEGDSNDSEPNVMDKLLNNPIIYHDMMRHMNTQKNKSKYTDDRSKVSYILGDRPDVFRRDEKFDIYGDLKKEKVI